MYLYYGSPLVKSQYGNFTKLAMFLLVKKW
nr:MAG TPA: hypothetical protein [Herelleviridae sp.]